MQQNLQAGKLYRIISTINGNSKISEVSLKNNECKIIDSISINEIVCYVSENETSFKIISPRGRCGTISKFILKNCFMILTKAF
jgi:hypothetical protein